MSLFPAPRWVINLGLVTAAAVLPMLAASFVLTLVQVGLLPEPDNGVMWKAVQIVLLSMGPGLVLFATRRRDKDLFQATGRTS